MNFFHAPATLITNDIEEFAASYPNPGGRPWHSKVEPEGEEGRYVVRTWDGIVRGDHLCWVKFKVREQEDTSQVSASVCTPAHHAEKVRQHIFTSLLKAYGSE